MKRKMMKQVQASHTLFVVVFVVVDDDDELVFFLFFFALKEDQYLLSPIPVSSDEVAEVLQYWAS